LLRIFKSVSTAAKGSIGRRDDLIPGQECSKRQRSNRLSSAEGAYPSGAMQRLHRPRKGSAEATGG